MLASVFFVVNGAHVKIVKTLEVFTDTAHDFTLCRRLTRLGGHGAPGQWRRGAGDGLVADGVPA
jgi:hypothetical protein